MSCALISISLEFPNSNGPVLLVRIMYVGELVSITRIESLIEFQ